MPPRMSSDRSFFEQVYAEISPPTQEPVREARTITPPSFESQRITRATIGGPRNSPRRLSLYTGESPEAAPAVRPTSAGASAEEPAINTPPGGTLTDAQLRDIVLGRATIRPADRSPAPTLADYADESLDLAEQLAARTVRDANDTMRNETARIFALLAELDRAAKAGKSAKAESAESKPRAERATNNLRSMQTTVELVFAEDQEDERG